MGGKDLNKERGEKILGRKRGKIAGEKKALGGKGGGGGGEGSQQGKVAKDLREENGEDLRGGNSTGKGGKRS